MKKNQVNEVNYEAPQVEVILVEVEKGFANSGPTTGSSSHYPGFE